MKGIANLGLSRWSALAVKIALPFVALALLFLAMHRFGGTGWPLAGADLRLVGAAIFFFVLANLLRAHAWHKLYPEGERPTRLSLVSGVAVSGASAPFLPARLDVPVKVAVINRLEPTTRLSTIGVSIISLGLADFAAMLPVSLLAALTADAPGFKLIALLLAGANAVGLLILFKGKPMAARLLRISPRRAKRAVGALVERIADTSQARGAVVGLAGCWALRATAIFALMAALGMPNLLNLVFVYLALGALSCAIPFSPGGAAMQIGAGTAILLGCGVSGKLATSYATSTSMIGLTAALTTLVFAVLATTAALVAPRLQVTLRRVGVLRPAPNES